MHGVIASRIMARTTLDIDPNVLRDLKQRARAEGKSLGRLVSEIAAAALKRPLDASDRAAPFRWHSRAMGARVDLEDKDAVRAALRER